MRHGGGRVLRGREDLAALEKDYEEIGAETLGDGEGEDMEEDDAY